MSFIKLKKQLNVLMFFSILIYGNNGICKAQADAVNEVGRLFEKGLTLEEESKVFSSSPDFLRATGWDESGSSLRENIYEELLPKADLESPHTHFKKLLKLFASDHRFRCRFPIANLYFEKTFGRFIQSTKECSPWDQIQFYDLIPERVKSVSVIWVDAGTEVISQFGHLALGFNFLPNDNGDINVKPDEFSAVVNISASLTGRTVIYGNELDTDLNAKLAKIQTDGTPWAITVMFKSLIGTNPLQISYQDKRSFLDEKAQEERRFHVVALDLTENERAAMLLAINKAMTHSGSFDYSLFTSGCSTIITDLLGRIHFTKPSIDGVLPSAVFANIVNRQREDLEYPPQLLKPLINQWKDSSDSTYVELSFMGSAL